jgi:hypothetical protein
MTEDENDRLPKGCVPGKCHLVDFCCEEETGCLPPCAISDKPRPPCEECIYQARAARERERLMEQIFGWISENAWKSENGFGYDKRLVVDVEKLKELIKSLREGKP